MANYEAIAGSRGALRVINELVHEYGEDVRTRDVFPLHAGYDNDVVGVGFSEVQDVTLEGLDTSEVSPTGKLIGTFACRVIEVVPPKIHHFTGGRMTIGGRMPEDSALWVAANLRYESPTTATTVIATVNHNVRHTFSKDDGKDLDTYFRSLANPDEDIPAIRPHIHSAYQSSLPKTLRFETDDEEGTDYEARKARRQEVERGIVLAFQQKYPHMELLGVDSEGEISPTELPSLASWLREAVPESARIRELERLEAEAQAASFTSR